MGIFWKILTLPASFEGIFQTILEKTYKILQKTDTKHNNHFRKIIKNAYENFGIILDISEKIAEKL